MRIYLIACLLVSGCNHNGGDPPMDAAADLMQPVGVALEATCTDSIDSIYTAPSGTLPTEGGTILRCAKDKDLPQADLQALLQAQGVYTSRAVDGGAHVYRVLYKTERGTTPPIPGYSSALVLLPDTPRAGKLPVLVANHGTRGEAKPCAPSLNDPSDPANDFIRLAYSMVGYGYAVIAPDNAGWANWNAAGNPLPGFLHAVDEGKSSLDGARALRKLIPSSLTDQVVLIGHSQGGHTSLAALALSDSYGSGGTVAAVATFSPLWIPLRTWGALLAIANSYPFDKYGSVNAFDIWYHYTAGELLDGQGHGVDVFAAAKRAGVKDLVESICLPPTWEKLTALGTDASSIYDPAFINSIAQTAAGFQNACNAGDALCTKWMQRYADDRPHITGHAATVPMFIAWGSADTTIPSDRVTCGIERLKTDGITPTICVDPGVDHSDIVGTKADVVADWIAQQTLGGPAPTACPSSTITDAMGMPAMCSALPPNSP